ncbi:MAG: ATP synthase F1 subunit delta [Bacteroidota bacterium]
MSSGRIAIRYATPLLELATEHKILEEVRSDMQMLVQLTETNRDLVLMLRSPIIQHLKKGQVLQSMFKGKVHELTLRFLRMIASKGRENLLPEVAAEFIRLYNTQSGLQEAIVTTAFPIDGQIKKDFEKLVTDYSGKKALLEVRVEESIIGGYTLQMGDRKLDASISGKLRELKLKFSKQEN